MEGTTRYVSLNPVHLYLVWSSAGTPHIRIIPHFITQYGTQFCLVSFMGPNEMHNSPAPDNAQAHPTHRRNAPNSAVFPPRERRKFESTENDPMPA